MIWDELLKSHPDYRNDDINKKDTGLVVRRYLRALRQLGEPEPPDTPFRELIVGGDKDITLDPFDAIEMTRPRVRPGRRSPRGPAGGARRRPVASRRGLEGIHHELRRRTDHPGRAQPRLGRCLHVLRADARQLDTGGLRFVHQLEDIETLNRRALDGELEVSAVSIHAFAHLADRYALLGLGLEHGRSVRPDPDHPRRRRRSTTCGAGRSRCRASSRRRS